MSRRSPWARRDEERDDWRRHRPAAPWPTTALWRWRYEVLVTSGLSGGVVGLTQVAGGAHQAVAIVVATGATAASVPTVRRVSVQVWWHVLTPHLFRRCCADLGFVDHNGRLPAVLRTRTTRQGQHLTVWASAGVSLKDFRKARDELATGLWAQDVLVRRHRRFGQLVVVTVVRDDVTSPRALSPRSWPTPEEWGWRPDGDISPDWPADAEVEVDQEVEPDEEVEEVEEDLEDEGAHEEPAGPLPGRFGARAGRGHGRAGGDGRDHTGGDEAAFTVLPRQRRARLGVEGGTA